MQIEFDPKKATANLLNHEGITFDEAKPALLDPYALTMPKVSIDLSPWAWGRKVEFWSSFGP